MNEVSINESFKITGFKATTTNKDESDLKTSVIDKLWNNFFKSGVSNESNVKYGVYFNYKDKYFGKYDILVGTKNSKKQTLDTVEIQKGKYLVFKKEGRIPEIVIELWQEIWHFFENSTIKRTYTTDFEKYIDNNKVEIYISIL
ncbi:hypothetical protein BB381_07210 [Campylobacter pinnipediorum subsp. caledonicus]|uniref:GyrI-like domain-containing protein n=1 Tax=Campylobacter pinnipediorum TaxID=1965231 RepID=UPI0009953DE3|nr:effector binding domain-containing protein [Campylobacter pinnipediorum]OPA71805.1 hypothetical protein BB381_07210 [Campylobacter pinnipediorum subsp. caledonicus]